jgi:hypothetical protein
VSIVVSLVQIQEIWIFLEKDCHSIEKFWVIVTEAFQFLKSTETSDCSTEVLGETNDPYSRIIRSTQLAA